MKVLLVNGSPHKDGCTFTALNQVANALKAEGLQTQLYQIGNQPISGCRACGACEKIKECAVNDGVNEFRQLAKAADGFIFGTPVYFAGINGNLKCFMDRLFFSDLWGRNHTFSLKPAAAVVSARRSGATAAYDQLNKYFGLLQMPIVSSTYWNMTFGMKPSEILSDSEGLKTLENLGKNMAYFLKCIAISKHDGLRNPIETVKENRK